MDQNISRKRVLEIKEKLMNLKSIYKNSDPLQEFSFVRTNSVNLEAIENFKHYPEEYKLFLEIIGTVYVACADAFMLEVCIPRNLDDCWWISNEDIRSSDNFRIIVNTDNDEINYVIYDVCKTPFKRYHVNEEDLKLSFLDIVEKKVEKCLSN
jgi:hypothetical protein